MNPRYDIPSLAPDLADALDPAGLAALERAAGDADVRLALDKWSTLRRGIAESLADDLPSVDLLVLYALDDEPLTPDEEARLSAARQRVDAAVQSHPGLQAIVSQIRDDRDAFYDLADQEEVAATRRSRTDRVDRAPVREPGRRPTTSRWVWRAAAVVAVALFVLVSVLLVQRDAGFETIRTATNETRTVTLPDASTVHLAPNTELAYRMGEGTERHVRISGEAVFEVMPAAEVFVVESPSAYTTVLGTTFSVRADANTTEVVLAHGAVQLASRVDPDAVILLEPGQRSRVMGSRAPESPTEADVVGAMSWTGTWYFQATTLGEISQRLSTHYGVPIGVPQDLANERITGAFDQEVPVQETLQTLATALGIQVERDADGGFRFAPADE